jgi:hypothetical protein
MGVVVLCEGQKRRPPILYASKMRVYPWNEGAACSAALIIHKVVSVNIKQPAPEEDAHSGNNPKNTAL